MQTVIVSLMALLIACYVLLPVVALSSFLIFDDTCAENCSTLQDSYVVLKCLGKFISLF